jgi:hypothetical protein
MCRKGVCEMFKLLNSSESLPKWFKVVVKTLLIITVIYWLAILVYKIVDGVRAFLHFISSKNNWWMFMVCMVVMAVVWLLLAQYYFGLDPFGKFEAWILENVEDFKKWFDSKNLLWYNRG